MWVYLQYFITWVFFMAVIAAIAILSPKIAKAIDKKRKKCKDEKVKSKESFFEFPTEEEIQKARKPDDSSDSDRSSAD